MKNKNSQRGYARWKGISKKDRSAEMSRVAKIKSAKYMEYKQIAENLTKENKVV